MSRNPRDEGALDRAAEAVAKADALLIGAGAGMGVDSGLPDFRGSKGFWQAYPPYKKLGLDFVSLANPRWFLDDPTLAWGFYGHRLNLYRQAQPHAGFHILTSWAGRMKRGAFIFTSNVDGHFQRAGFPEDSVVEIHGSVHWMQCTRHCGIGTFPADPFQVTIDETTMRAREPLPICPHCGALARPNILMFNDWSWESSRTSMQQSGLNAWLRQVGNSPTVIIECGAGTAIPTVRRFCEEAADSPGRSLIRINLREPEVPEGHLALAMGALEGLRYIDKGLGLSRTGVSPVPAAPQDQGSGHK
jgi:NAD-dependent SIR2 family protein deacetylase